MAGLVPDWGNVSTLVALRWRDIAGRQWRFIAAACGLWVLLSMIGATLLVGEGIIGPAEAGVVITGIVIAWIAAPLIGAGSTEVAPRTRLVSFPIDDVDWRAATWLASVSDVPVILAAGFMVGLCIAVAGWVAGAIGGLALIVFATAGGQVTAEVATRVANRWQLRGTAIMVITIVAVVSAAVSTGVVTISPGGVSGVGSWLAPATWLDAAWEAGGVWWVPVSAAIAIAGVIGYGVVTKWAIAHRETLGGESPQPRSRLRPWLWETSRRGVVSAMWFSLIRASTTRMIIFGAMAAPVFLYLGRDLGLGKTPWEVAVMLAAVVSLGVNLWAYTGPGMALVVTAPIPGRWWVLATATALAALLIGAVVVGGVVSTIVGIPVELDWGFACRLGGYAAALTGLAVWWSGRYPVVADHTSLRSRPSSMKSTLGFITVCTVALSMLDAVSVMPAAPAILGVVIAVWCLRSAIRRFGTERSAIAAALRG